MLSDSSSRFRLTKSQAEVRSIVKFVDRKLYWTFEAIIYRTYTFYNYICLNESFKITQQNTSHFIVIQVLLRIWITYNESKSILDITFPLAQTLYKL